VPPYRIFEHADHRETGLLAMASRDLRDGLRGVGSEADRKAFLPGGAEFQKVQGYADTVPKLFSLGRAIAEDLNDLQQVVREADPPGTFETIRVVKQAKAALRPDRALITKAEELDRIQKDLGEVSAFLADFLPLYRRAVETWYEARDHGATDVETNAMRLRSRLRGEVAKDALPTYSGGVDELQQEIGTGAGGGGFPAAFAAVEAEPGLVRVRVHRPTRGEAVLNDQDPILVPPDTVRKKLRRNDFWYSVLSAAVVVGSGMSAVWVANATFGSLSDYVGALLWGAGVGEGLKLARRIVPDFVGKLTAPAAS
jgi:hypothetical protein